MKKDKVRLTVNGRSYEFLSGRDFEPGDTLSKLLRERLGLTGVRESPASREHAEHVRY